MAGTNSKKETARIDVDEGQEGAFEPVRLAVDRDQRADPDGRRDGRDLERREDEIHVLAHDRAEEHQDRRHEQGDLEARAEGHGQRELHLVLGRQLDRDEVLGEVADRRDDDHADEEERQVELLDERVDRADEDLGQDGQQGRRAEQHDDRDPTGPGRPTMLVCLARGAEGRVRVGELEDQRQAVADDQDDRDQAPIPR